MSTTDPTPLLAELHWLKRVTEDDTTDIYGRCIASIEGLTGGLEEVDRDLRRLRERAGDKSFRDVLAIAEVLQEKTHELLRRLRS